MSNERRNNPTAQVIVGLGVIAVGLLFLLDNMGWLDLDLGVQLWPVILIVAGVLKLTQARSTSGNIVGGILVLFGALMLLKSLGLLYFGWNVLLPLAMIGAGLAVVFRSALPKSSRAPNLKGTGDDCINGTAILGGYKRRVTSQNFAGGEISVLMGGCEIDLRDASFTGEAVLNVFSMMGGVEIKVPVDWTVQLEGVPILGGFEENTMRPQDGSKRLIVRGYAIMGGLEIRN
jgi:hypothetical protein